MGTEVMKREGFLVVMGGADLISSLQGEDVVLPPSAISTQKEKLGVSLFGLAIKFNLDACSALNFSTVVKPSNRTFRSFFKLNLLST
jgi:hypothetical protein